MMGSGGWPPEKIFRATPSRKSENVLLEHKIKVAVCAQKGSLSFKLEMNDEQATLDPLSLPYSAFFSTFLDKNFETKG